MNKSSLHRLIMCVAVASCFGIATLVIIPQPVLAVPVIWNVDSDGFWQIPGNWSPNLPGSADDVTIDRAAATITVTHSLGSDTINSLTCNEALVLSGGSLSINNAAQINSGFTINGGTVNFNGGSDSSVSGVATFSSGSIGGSGAVSFDNLTWTGGGSMAGTGSTEILVGKSMTLSGAGYHLLARTIDNYGTTTVTGSYGLNPYSGGSTPTFNNKAGGIYELQSTGGLDSYSTLTGVFNNEGTFRKTTGTSTATVSAYWTLNNPGTVQVQSGTLSISGAFNNTGTAEVQAGKTMTLSGGGTSTGAFNVLSGATLNFSGGTHSLGGAAFSNAGTINFNGGTENFNGATATTVPGAATLSSIGTTLGGSGTVNFSNLTWTNGTMSGSGTTTATGIIFSGNGDPLLNGRTLTNSGTATFSDMNYLHGKNGAIFNNMEGAVVDLQGTNDFKNDGGTLPVVNNAGTFRKSVSIGNINIQFAMNNTGTVQVQNGTLTFQGGVTQLVGDTLTGGTWNVKANSTLNITTGSNIITNQGDVTLDGVGSTFAKINSLANNQGDFSVLNGRNFTTVGDLANSGTVTVGSGSDFDVTGGITGAGDLIVNGTLTTDSIFQDTFTLGAGARVTIRAIPGGHMDAQYQITPVPEPATITLLLLAGLGLGLWRSRR